MIFNTRLLQGMEDFDVNDIKVLLYFIQEDLPIQGYITNHPSDEDIHWTADYLGKLQDIVLALEENGSIEGEYRNNSRFRLCYPLYVTQVIQTLDEEYVQKCRFPFTHKYCGESSRVPSSKICTDVLTKFLSLYPEMKEDLPEVIKYRIDVMPDFVPNWYSFLNLSDDKVWRNKGKDVHGFYEQWKNNNNVKRTSFL